MSKINLGALRRAWTTNERKDREDEISSTIDGRSLRATGRTEQFNFRCRDGYKALAIELARERNITIGELMETLLDRAREEDSK